MLSIVLTIFSDTIYFSKAEPKLSLLSRISSLAILRRVSKKFKHTLA